MPIASKNAAVETKNTTQASAGFFFWVYITDNFHENKLKIKMNDF